MVLETHVVKLPSLIYLTTSVLKKRFPTRALMLFQRGSPHWKCSRTLNAK